MCSTNDATTDSCHEQEGDRHFGQIDHMMVVVVNKGHLGVGALESVL